MPPPWKRLWGVTHVALETVAARPTRGVVSKDYWEQIVSFVHYYDQTVAMGAHDCGAAGEGTGKNSFSVFLLDALTAATISVPVMFPSVTLGGIPTTSVLLPPTVPPTIHSH